MYMLIICYFIFIFRKHIVGDLTAVRGLCVQLDKTKDSLTRQLASVSSVDEQTQSELLEVLAERDLLKQQVMIILDLSF